MLGLPLQPYPETLKIKRYLPKDTNLNSKVRFTVEMTDVQCIILDLLDCVNSEMLIRHDFRRETEFGGSVERNGLTIG